MKRNQVVCGRAGTPELQVVALRCWLRALRLGGSGEATSKEDDGEAAVGADAVLTAEAAEVGGDEEEDAFTL